MTHAPKPSQYDRFPLGEAIETSILFAKILSGAALPEDIFLRASFIKVETDATQKAAWIGEIDFHSSMVSVPEGPIMQLTPKSRLALFSSPDRLAFASPEPFNCENDGNTTGWIFVAYLPPDELGELLEAEEGGMYFSAWFDSASLLPRSGLNSTWFYCSPLGSC